MKKLFVIFISLVLSGTLRAQQNTRMERDLKVFETMLEEYLYKSHNENPFGQKRVQAEYFEGFGVIVKLAPKHHSFERFDMDFDMNFRNDFKMNGNFFIHPEIELPDLPDMPDLPKLYDKVIDLNGKTIIINDGQVEILENKEGHKRVKRDIDRSKKDMERAKREAERSKKEAEVAKKEFEKSRKEFEKERKEAEKQRAEMMKEREEMRKTMLKRRDSLMVINNKELEESLRTFLVQYADLLSELKPNERIRLMYSEGSNHNEHWEWNSNGQNVTVTKNKNDKPKGKTFLEVYKSDVDAYKGSKIAEKDFKDKIKKSQPETNEKNEMSIELLAGVLDKVIQNIGNEGVLRKVGRTQSFYLEGFGVKYDTKVFLKRGMKRMRIEEESYDIHYDEKGNKVIRIESGHKNKEKDNEKSKEKDKNKDKEWKESLKKIEEEQKEQKVKREKEVQEYQDELEKIGKEYLISYGKTLLGTLKNSEKLTWNVTFVEPRDFGDDDDDDNDEGNKKEKKEMKKSIKTLTLIVSRQTLEQYDNKQLSLEQAMGQIKVDKK